MPYTVQKSADALGITHAFVGPGLPQYAREVHFMQHNNEWANKCMADDAEREDGGLLGNVWDRDADRVLRFLQAAFDAGREDMKREFRELLGGFHR